MNTPQAPDYGEPWKPEKAWPQVICNNGGVHAMVQVIDKTSGLRERIIQCVNACAGMADPAAEITAMREAIKEAHGALQMVVLETLKHWDSTKPLPCVGTIENAANVALAKLKPFIKP